MKEEIFIFEIRIVCKNNGEPKYDECYDYESRTPHCLRELRKEIREDVRELLPHYDEIFVEVWQIMRRVRNRKIGTIEFRNIHHLRNRGN